MKWKVALGAALLCAGGAFAAPISGTFQMNGIVTATSTTLTWEAVSGTPADQFSLSLGTGSFAVEDGADVDHNLNNTTEPVGVVFAAQDFIDFTVAAGLPSLLVDFIPSGNGGSAGCSQPASGTVPPQTCTPVIPGGSPITFENNNVNGAVTGSSATFTLSGITSDGLSTWNGIFTSQFVGESYQQVLQTLGTTGSVTASFSANVVVTAVPEPGALLLSGAGLLFALLGFRRRRQI